MWRKHSRVRSAALPTHHARGCHGTWVLRLAFSPDGRTIAAINDRGRVWLQPALEGRSLTAVGNPPQLARPDPVVLIWDLGTGLQRRAVSKATCMDTSVFTSDGRVLAMIASEEMRAIRLRDAESGSPIGSITVPHGPTCSIAVSPDARLVATIADGRLASVWSAATGRELCRLDGQAEVLNCLAFSPDETIVAAAGNDGDNRPEIPLIGSSARRSDRPKRRTVALRASVGSTGATSELRLRCRRTDARRLHSDTPQERACVRRVVHPEHFLMYRRDEAEGAAIARRRRRERRRAKAPEHSRSP